MSTAIEYQRGEIVIVQPSDSDDPMAIEWQGRQCRVELHAHGYVYNYVRVRDVESGHRATFRERDVRRGL